MTLSLRAVSGLVRSGFNALAPSILYRPKFNVGDILVPRGVETGDPVDLPRFGGDTLIHVLGGFAIQIARVSRGEYSSDEPQAEFNHTKFGYPHYEIKVLEYGGAFDNHGRTVLPVGSKIHVDAQIFDERFEVIPKATIIAA